MMTGVIVKAALDALVELHVGRLRGKSGLA
jgi:hypothetical protein